MKAKIDYVVECIARVGGSEHGLDSDVFSRFTPEETVQISALEHDIRCFGDMLAADPFFFDILSSYMVDVKGTGPSPSPEEVENAIADMATGNDFADYTNRIGGGMAEAVRRFIDNLGYTITDCGFGGGGWHVGVPGNEPGSRKLCAALHKHFLAAINSGIIKVERHQWGHRLPSLYNDLDVENYYFGEDQ